MRKIATALALSAAVVAPVALAAPSDAATRYGNCKSLNSVYPHGVGKAGAVDHTSGVKVRNFKVSYALYTANKGLDRDKDGIACEKR